MKLTRRYRFSASHRLDTPDLTAEENRRLYGKCNNPYGHGHDYVIEVTVEGSAGNSGLIVSRGALDRLVTDRVLIHLDHKNLNEDVAALSSVVPTTENLALAIGKLLGENWPFDAKLRGIRVTETDRNMFELEIGA